MSYPGLIQDASNPTPISAQFIIRQSIAPASVAANSAVEQTFTVPSLQVGDFVDVVKPSFQTGLSIGNVRVSAANTIAIQFVNVTAGAIVPTTETYLIGGMR